MSEPGLKLVPLADIQPRKQRWLVHGLIPLRTLTLVAGVGGLGKSMWLAGVAARLSCGDPPADTVIVSYEDTAAEVLRPRVEAAGGAVERVHVIVPEHRDWVEPVALPRDVDAVEELVRSVAAKLLVIDPIVAAIILELDAHKDQHVRAVLARLAELAEAVDCAVAIVGHLNKAPTTDAYLRVANSAAFWNAARSVVLVTEDGDGDRRLVAQRKANYARLSPVERHRIEEVLTDSLDPETRERLRAARMVFVEYADDVDAADVLAPQRTTKTESAEAVLEAMLADGERHESAAVKKLMQAAGFKERTVERAAEKLRVQVEREGYPAVTRWRLPDATRLVAPSATPKIGATGDSAQPSGFEGASDLSRADSSGEGANGATGAPLPGDKDFDDFLRARLDAGHITRAEAFQRYEFHKLIR
jgi:putative DNA primase/helicase